MSLQGAKKGMGGRWGGVGASQPGHAGRPARPAIARSPPTPTSPAPLAHSLAGRAAYYAGDVAGAEGHFQAASKLDGARLDAWEGIALAELARGDPAGAAVTYEALVRGRCWGMRWGGRGGACHPGARRAGAGTWRLLQPAPPHLPTHPPRPPPRHVRPSRWTAPGRPGRPTRSGSFCGARPRLATAQATRPALRPLCAPCWAAA